MKKIAIFVLLGFSVILSPAKAVALPAGFEMQTVASGLNLPTSFAFAPDGRIFIAEKAGTVKVVKNGTLLATPLITLTDVNSYGDRGLIGIAVDPNFTQNGYLYLSYTYENTPGAGFAGIKTGHIARVTVVGDTADESSKLILVGTTGGNAATPSCDNYAITTDCIPSDAPSHSIGGLHFGPDGKLYATTGDGAHFDYADSRSLRAQNIDSLAGKILRINKDGTAPSDNPFYNGNANANRSKVYAYGFRNMYRFNFRPSNGSLYGGDVGWNTWEEINKIVAGGNYGWPCREGAAVTGGYPACTAPGFIDPLYYYGHNAQGAAAVTAGSFPTGSAYPAQYLNTYFFGDYAQNWIKNLNVTASDGFISVTDFGAAADKTNGPVDIETGPEGNIYFIAIYTGELKKITHTLGNRQPIAEINASPTSGLAPLSVNFSSAGSIDPDADPITFLWNFGDSTTSTSTNPTHVYNVNGTYSATLTVFDNRGGQQTKSISISVGNRAPTASISSPTAGSLYRPNQIVTLTGAGTDPEDGALPASSLSWRVIIHHNTHIHIYETRVGNNINITAPDHADPDVYTEIELTVTDSGGLQHKKSVNIYLNNSSTGISNLIQNPSMETPDPANPNAPQFWSQDWWGNLNPIFTYPVPGFEGANSKAAKVQITQYTSGDAKWDFSPVSVEPNKEYSFSNYYMSNVESSLVAQVDYINGTKGYFNLGLLPPATTWTKVSRVFTTPTNARSLSILHVIDSVGSLTVDNYSLSLGTSTPPPPPPPATTTNLIQNPSFEIANGADPLGWNRGAWGPNTPSFTYPVAGRDGGKAVQVKLIAYTDGDAKWYPNNISITPGVRYRYSDWYKADDISDVIGEYTMDNGTFQYFGVVKELPPSVDWKEATGVFTAPAGVKSITFMHLISSLATLTIDDVSLTTVSTSTPPPPPPPPPATTTNIIQNPSLEEVSPTDATLPNKWQKKAWGTNTATFTYPVAGFDGAKAASINVSSYTDGDLKWYFDEVPVTPGSVYTFSENYKSTVPTNITVKFKKTDGGIIYMSLGDPVSAANWTPRTSTFTVPPGVASLTIFHLIESVGTLDIDNYSLTTGSSTPPSPPPSPSKDTTPPIISITAPTASSTVSGTTTIQISATDNIGVVSVHMFIGDENLGTDTTYPYGTSINTKSLPNGVYKITAWADDAAGNIGNATPIFITINNPEPIPTSPNLIANPGLEIADPTDSTKPADWFKSSWGTNNAAFSYPVTGIEGARAVRVEIGTYTNGDAKWFFKDVPVSAGNEYNFKEKYRGNIQSVLTARFTYADNSFQYRDIITLPPAADWSPAETSIIVPTGAIKMTLFHLIAGVGFLETDALYLAGTTTPVQNTFNQGLVTMTFDDGWLSQYQNALPILSAANLKASFYIISQESLQALPDNRISNGNLDVADAATSSLPKDWSVNKTGVNNAAFSYPTLGVGGSKAARIDISSFGSGEAEWIPADTTVINGQNYSYKESYQSNVETVLTARFTYSDNTVGFVQLAILPPAADWTLVTKTISMPANLAKVTIYHSLKSVGFLTIDNADLNRVQVYMNPAQIQALWSAGHEIGAHTRTHVDLTAIPFSEAAQEIGGSRSDLLGIGISPVDTFVYPYGTYNTAIQQELKNDGFLGSRATEFGYNFRNSPKYALQIQQVDQTTTFAQFQSWVDSARNNKSWLILMFHQVDNSGLQFSVTPALFQQMASFLATQQVNVVTLKQGIQQMLP